ncbi:unnamed protein product [Polarella glacialis]|uniref:Uncharacterized protein n=1 Tax=Polarella glacialis TaxID=89957 RepID=A0A813E9H9_POLGL|nr:unnamed protein product [Polarella glacialis]CAE8713991.1 unnamed protein product [Polarella glacialis]
MQATTAADVVEAGTSKSPETASIAPALATVQHRGWPLMVGTSKAAAAGTGQSQPRSLAGTLRACTAMALHEEQLPAAALAATHRQLTVAASSSTPQCSAAAAWPSSKLELQSAALSGGTVGQSLRTLSHPGPQEVSNNGRQHSTSLRTDLALADATLAAPTARAAGCKVQELANRTRSYAQPKIKGKLAFDAATFAAMDEALLEAEARHLSSTAWAPGTLLLTRPPLVGAVCTAGRLSLSSGQLLGAQALSNAS